MGKQALTSHAKGKKHAGLEAVRKRTVPVSVLLAASGRGPNATASDVSPAVLPATAGPSQLIVSSDSAINSVRVLENKTVSFSKEK